MTTLQELQSDLELRLTRGKPSDDIELDKRQSKHWFVTSRDAMVANDQNARLRAGLDIDKFYLETEECKVLENNNSTCVGEDCFDKYYVDATYDILKLDDDKGLYHVTNHDNIELHQIDHADIDILRSLKFAKPAHDNLTFFREGTRLYIQGVKKRSKQFVNITVTYIPALQSKTLTDTEQFPIAPDLIAPLLDTVEEIARREMDLRNYEDVTNDGDQE